MAELLLINPRRRRRASTTRRRRNPLAARTRAVVLSRRRRVVRRRRNPMPVQLAARRRTRMSNPIAMRRRVMRRRPNPLGGAMLMAAIRQAFIGGAGAVAVDFIYGYIQKLVPGTTFLATTPGKVGAGDAVKAIATVALGHFLAGPTRGLSRRMAEGALTVQSANIMKSFLPASITGQMGYFNPAVTTYGTPIVGSNFGMGAYTKGTPLLNAYQRPGAPTPLLSKSRMSAQDRENVYAFR